MRSFLYALGFLTLFPSLKPESIKIRKIGESTVFFPLVGLFLGLILVGLNSILLLIFSKEIVNILLIAVFAVMTGGIHLDGLADVADGFFGGRNREEALRIMADSSIGTFGVLALIFLLFLKFFALNSIFGKIKIVALILMPTYGRWSAVYAALIYPPAREKGLGKIFADYTKGPQFFWASLEVFALTVLFLEFRALSVLVALMIFSAIVAYLLSKKIKGVTGDSFGALIELTEVWFLLVISFLF